MSHETLPFARFRLGLLAAVGFLCALIFVRDIHAQPGIEAGQASGQLPIITNLLQL